MPKTIVTLTVLPVDKVREHDRFIQIDCDKRTVRLLAVIAVLEAVCSDWWDKPAVKEKLLNALTGRLPPVLQVPGGEGSVAAVLEAARRKLNAIPNVEVVIVRCDMPASAYP